LLNAKNYDAAIVIFRLVLDKDPKYYAALWNMGEALVKVGDHKQAMIYYSKSLSINPNYTGGPINLPDILVCDLSSCTS